ncbi:cytoplasmic protein [Fomitiporia mediterranea MF3/22]|uniref:cytoplasmic protein n=1 Tax=Fomitiporia mediterranea (strain MF3/22) TaxID=694068 RepID=UPI0004408B8E|nr:cytoplasmic protein [Fomitiporia mediterranea MF3/22]EJC98373.1 cytoplasmic protein [Fomitiporia mediterranea MF3/22]
MVLFFTSTAMDPPVTIYMGKDKFENEDLIKYAWPQDVWFHVDKLSSAHVYVRLPESVPSWEGIPQAVLDDAAQLVKANSIEGNKKDNQTIIYTPASNLKKTGDMAVGQVSFHSDKKVSTFRRSSNIVLDRWRRIRRSNEVRVVHHHTLSGILVNHNTDPLLVYVEKRENAIVNRLNKTKVEREVDHEAERVERLRKEKEASRVFAATKRKEAEELAKQRAAEKAARDYALLDVVDPEDGEATNEPKSVQEMMDDFM